MKRSLPIFLVLLFLGALGSAAIFIRLQEDPYLRGTDAYYYALQADYWARTGEVKIPDSSPVYRIAGGFKRAGLSMETAQRLWIALSLAVVSLGAGLLLLAGHRPGNSPRVILYLWLLASPSTLFTAIEFPKMFSWAMLIPFWFLPLLGERKHFWWAIPVSLGAVLLHRAALPPAAVFSGMVLLLFRWGRWKWRWTHILPGICTLGILTTVYFYFFPDHLTAGDFARLKWQDLKPGFLTLLSRENLPTAIRMELLLAPLFFALVAFRFWHNADADRREILFPLGLALPAFFPFGSEEVFGVGERYAILLPMILLTGALFLSARTPAPVFSAWKKAVMGTAIGGVAVFAVFLRLEAAHPASLDPDYVAFDRITVALQQEDIPMLIAQRSLVFFYKAKLAREAFPYEPEDHWNRQRIWRVIYRINPEELDYYLEARCKWRSGLIKPLPVPDFTLLREDCWQEMRAKITFAENTDLHEKVWRTHLNPAQKRPPFLYAKHRGDPAGEFSAVKN